MEEGGDGGKIKGVKDRGMRRPAGSRQELTKHTHKRRELFKKGEGRQK